MKSKIYSLICFLLLFALNFQGELNAQCAGNSQYIISQSTMSFPATTYLHNVTGPINTPIEGLNFTTAKVGTGNGGIYWATNGSDVMVYSNGGATYRGGTLTFNKPLEKTRLHIGNLTYSPGGSGVESEEALITAYDKNGNAVRYTTFTPDAGSYATATKVTNSGVNNATTKIDGTGNGTASGGVARATFYFEGFISKITIQVRNTGADRDGSGFIQFIGGCAESNSSLPLTFSDISAYIQNEMLEVNWTTATERENDHFEIEVSKDGKTWSKAGNNINTKATDPNATAGYSYEQTISLTGMTVMGMSLFLLSMGMMFRRSKWLGSMLVIISMSAVLYGCSKKDVVTTTQYEKLYVRVKQVDTDGAVTYSKVVIAVIK